MERKTKERKTKEKTMEKTKEKTKQKTWFGSVLELKGLMRMGLILIILVLLGGCAGKDGKDGMDGKDGKAGMDGKDGKDGKDGMSMDGGDARITVKGSDTMVELAQMWAEEYMKMKGQSVMIQVTGGGSGVGLSALVNKTTDLVNASREIEFDEREVLKVRDYDVMEYKVAQDGVSIYVNESNGVNELTMQDLMNIFSGGVKNWQDVGGKDEEMVVYGRDSSSGTYKFFRDKVLKGKDYTIEMATLAGTAGIVSAVGRDPKGIGYGGKGSASGVKLLKLKKDGGSEGYEPSRENVMNMSYPLSRYLYLYTTDKVLESKPYVKHYINWILSGRGQDMIEKSGYYKVGEMVMEGKKGKKMDN